MDKIRQFVDELTEQERQSLLVELLRPVLKSLDGERCVLDDQREIIGFVMSVDCRKLLIPARLADRDRTIDRSRCRPPSEVIKELKAHSNQDG